MSLVRCSNLVIGESCTPSKERSGCRIQGLMGPMPTFMPCGRHAAGSVCSVSGLEHVWSTTRLR